jgi:hypothetical protein
MPQLWLTFEEIADLFYCDTAGARRRVIASQWERRRYSDGLTRAQLPPEVAHEFMLRYSSKYESRGAAVDDFDAATASRAPDAGGTKIDTALWLSGDIYAKHEVLDQSMGSRFCATPS